MAATTTAATAGTGIGASENSATGTDVNDAAATAAATSAANITVATGAAGTEPATTETDSTEIVATRTDATLIAETDSYTNETVVTGTVATMDSNIGNKDVLSHLKQHKTKLFVHLRKKIIALPKI